MSATFTDGHMHDAVAAGSDFYYASLYLPPAVRDGLRALEATRREIAAIPMSCSDRGVAHVKLAWWHDEIERLGRDAARHDLAKALVVPLVTHPDWRHALLELVERTHASLDDGRFDDLTAVRYGVKTQHGAIVTAMIAASTATGDPQALGAMAVDVELAQAWCGLHAHRRAGTLWLATRDLERYGLNPERVRDAADSAPLQHCLRDLLETLATNLDAHLQRGSSRQRRDARLWLTLARCARRRVALTLADGCAVLERSVDLTPVEKLWWAWRTRLFG